MIIEVVIFFIWIFILLLVGVIVVLRGKRKAKLQGTDNIAAQLTFPQRNWLPLCIAIAVISPLAVAGFKSVTHKTPEQMPVTQNGTSYQSGDSTARDTSYHVATPPGNSPAPAK